MTTRLLATALFVLALAPAVASAQSPKIAVVDVQKAIRSIPDGKAAKDKLEKEAKKKQAELDKAQEKLKKMKDDLEKQAQLLQDNVKRKKLQAYQAELLALQEAYVQHQQELKEKEAKLLKPILEKLEKTIEGVAKDQKIVLVIERGAGVLYAEPDLDITDSVIKRYGK